MIAPVNSPSDFPAMANLNAPLPLAPGASTARIDKAAQDFEAMFATQMLQPMFETVPVNSAFGGGHGEEVMRSFMMQEYGKTIAKSGRLGIAPQVRAEMIRLQEQARSGKNSMSAPQTPTSYQNAAYQGGVDAAAR